MTATLPHAPTLYWNYVLGYEIRLTNIASTPPSPLASHPLCIGIMYYVTNEIVRPHHLCHDNDPTALPHLVLEL